MKILYESDLAGSRIHGMAHRIYQFSEEFVKMGHEVMIVGSSYSHARSVNPIVSEIITDETIGTLNYKWIKSPSYKGNGVKRAIHILIYNFRLWYYAKKLTKDFKPDIVIASGVTPLDFIGCNRIKRINKAKIILEVGDLWPLSPIELGGISKYNPFMMLIQFAENYSFKNTDAVVSLLPLTKEYMIAHGLYSSKFNYIPNGVVEGNWDTSKSLPLEYKNIIIDYRSQGKFLVGYTGTFSVSNALFILLDVAKRLESYSVQFILVGQGTIKEDLIKYSRDNKISNVSFLLPLPKTLIPSFLDQMDLLYTGFQKLPLYRFGVSPNKLFDYMMAGKPILQAIKAGNNIVEDAKCGLYADSDDVEDISNKIIKLKNMTEEEREKLGANGQKYVLKNHSYSVLTNQFLNVINPIDSVL